MGSGEGSRMSAPLRLTDDEPPAEELRTLP